MVVDDSFFRAFFFAFIFPVSLADWEKAVFLLGINNRFFFCMRSGLNFFFCSFSPQLIYLIF